MKSFISKFLSYVRIVAMVLIVIMAGASFIITDTTSMAGPHQMLFLALAAALDGGLALIAVVLFYIAFHRRNHTSN